MTLGVTHRQTAGLQEDAGVLGLLDSYLLTTLTVDFADVKHSFYRFFVEFSKCLYKFIVLFILCDSA